MATKCLKDNKNCYIHHDPETGDELRCRHYPGLINYGGTCPEAWEEWVKGDPSNSSKQTSGEVNNGKRA